MRYMNLLKNLNSKALSTVAPKAGLSARCQQQYAVKILVVYIKKLV